MALGTAIQYHMPVGIPGDITRMEFSKVEPQMVDGSSSGTYAPGAYGIPVKLTNGLVRKLATGDSALYGFLVRPYPYNGSVGAAAGLGGGVPPTTGPCDVLRSGYIAVKLAFGSPTRGSTAYVVTTANSSTGISGYGSAAVGDIVDSTTAATLNAASSGSAIACGIFMGPPDTGTYAYDNTGAASVAELAYNT